YQWQPPAMAQLFESFSDLAVDPAFGQLLSTTLTQLLLTDGNNVRMVHLANKGAARVLFANPGSNTVWEVLPSRPRTHDGGVLLHLPAAPFSRRDYSVDVPAPGNQPPALAAATTALADASVCGAAAHYDGPGVLYMQRYIYEGQSGLFAVDVAANG